MGGYVRSILVAGERLEFQTKVHWKVYFSLTALLTLWIYAIVKRASSEFAITNRRVIMKVGVISRRVLEVNMHQVESVSIEQTVAGRILGYGTVTIVGTGGTRETFHDISKPVRFRKKFQELAVEHGGYRLC